MRKDQRKLFADELKKRHKSDGDNIQHNVKYIRVSRPSFPMIRLCFQQVRRFDYHLPSTICQVYRLGLNRIRNDLHLNNLRCMALGAPKNCLHVNVNECP